MVCSQPPAKYRKPEMTPANNYAHKRTQNCNAQTSDRVPQMWMEVKKCSQCKRQASPRMTGLYYQRIPFLGSKFP